MTVEEIAKRCNVSVRTVQRYSRNAARRIKAAQEEATRGAVVAIQETTRENVQLGAKLVKAHLAAVIADPVRVSKMKVREIAQYAELSGKEYLKLRVMEGLDRPDVKGHGPALPTPANTFTPGQLPSGSMLRLSQVDIIPHQPGRIVSPPSLPAPADAPTTTEPEVITDASPTE